MKKAKNTQEPQNHENDHDSIQDRLDGSCHGQEAVNQPKENTDHDQNHEYLNQRHNPTLLILLLSAAGSGVRSR
jgi:hypothetical protein